MTARRRFPLVAGLLLLAVACGDAGEVGQTVPPTTAAPVVTTTTAVPATTAPPGTTTTAAPATTTSVVVTTTLGVDDSGYVVVGVADDDVLNVREGPGVEHPIVAELAPDATGVATTGFATGDWWEVTIDDGTGWVNSTFLALPAPLTDGFDARPCFTPPSTEAEGELSDADHLLALDHVVGGDDCERFVFLLGTGAYGYGPLWPFNADPVVPQGWEADVSGSTVTVALPAQVDLVRPTATEGDFGDALAFVVGREDGGLDVQLHFADPVDAEVFAAHDPARLLVDVRRLPSDGGRTLPYVGGQTAVLAADPLGEGATLPVTIRGYGRPFEAQGIVRLLTFDGELGAGEPVAATWDGIGGVSTGTEAGYMTSDWTRTWGSFEVTLVDVPAGPGRYQLFVGDLSAEDGEPVGVYVPIAIAG